MRHRKKVAKLGRTPSHRKALMMNLASALIQHGKIKTTDAKAKALRRVVERLITYGKKGTVHHRRLAYRVLQNRPLVKKLFDEIAPLYQERNGGYTRIVKLGFRDNDSAAVSMIELVDYRTSGSSKKATKTAKKSSKPKSGSGGKAKPEGRKKVTAGGKKTQPKPAQAEPSSDEAPVADATPDTEEQKESE